MLLWACGGRGMMRSGGVVDNHCASVDYAAQLDKRFSTGASGVIEANKTFC